MDIDCTVLQKQDLPMLLLLCRVSPVLLPAQKFILETVSWRTACIGLKGVYYYCMEIKVWRNIIDKIWSWIYLGLW